MVEPSTFLGSVWCFLGATRDILSTAFQMLSTPRSASPMPPSPATALESQMTQMMNLEVALTCHGAFLPPMLPGWAYRSWRRPATYTHIAASLASGFPSCSSKSLQLPEAPKLANLGFSNWTTCAAGSAFFRHGRGRFKEDYVVRRDVLLKDVNGFWGVIWHWANPSRHLLVALQMAACHANAFCLLTTIFGLNATSLINSCGEGVLYTICVNYNHLITTLP